jgi:hypothetical protein
VLKYVVVKASPGALLEELYSFPGWLNHKDFFKRMNFPQETLVSAGMIMGDDLAQVPTCRGESISLGVVARPKEDTLLLLKGLGWEDGEARLWIASKPSLNR